MALKRISVTLAIIMVICVTLSGCTPGWVGNIAWLMQDVNIVGVGPRSLEFEQDSEGRSLFISVSSEEKDNDEKGLIYMILNKYYGNNEITFTYIPDVYYFYDYENKGMESEEFQKFKERNNWNKERRLEEKGLVESTTGQTLRLDDEILEYYNEQYKNTPPEYRRLKIEKIMAQNKINDENFTQCGTISDYYSRRIYGINVPSTIEGESAKLYAVCLQADFGDTFYYLEDSNFTEIRLDKYCEDLESFKRVNNWEQKITLDELKKLPHQTIVAENLE